jgi:hypothetical protein
MQTVTPPPPTPLPVPVSGTQATAVSSNPPAQLALLPKGAILPAQVISQLPQGLVQIQTSQGSFDIRTAVSLAVGAKLDLQLLRAGPQAQFQIRTIDGNPVANGRGGQPVAAKVQGNAPMVTGADTGSTLAGGRAIGSGAAEHSASPKTGHGPLKLNAGSTIRAQYLEPAGNKAKPAAPAATAAPPGAEKTVPNVERPTPSLSRSDGAGASLKPSQSARENIHQVTQTAHRAPNVTAGAQISGTIVNAKILTITRPGEPAQSVTPAAAQTSIAGTVVGSNMAGTPLVQIPGGTLSLIGAAPLPAGTKLLLDLQATAQFGKPAAQIFSPNLAASREWPSLDQALDQLRQSAPDMARSFSQNQMPQANNRLAANILLYLSALRGGDVGKWLGELTRSLEQSQPELAGRLREDFVQVARLFNDGPQSEWRTLIIPFMNGEGLDAVQMHMRGQSGGADDDGDSEDASRFLVDIELSRLGRIQLDGLVKSNGKQFDLIFRSEKPLPGYMRKDISRVFHDFAELGGITGSLTFHASARFVHIPIDNFDGPLRSGLMV